MYFENFTALKSQAKIQFSVPFDSLDSNTKLKITLGATEHVFSVGTLINDVTDFHEIAAALRKGALNLMLLHYHFQTWVYQLEVTNLV